ncbi:MAG: hypothetical protein ACYS4T_19575, partial [Planctomycetota bacterium]
MKISILFLACVFMLQAPEALSIPVVARVDDFEDGTLQGWSGGAEQNNIATGGPSGAGDNYLEIHRPTASAPFPFHLGTKNTTTWSGDYLTVGIKTIEMDVNTISITSGPANLSLRIMLLGPGGAFSSKDPITIITEGGWQHIEFGLTRSDLVRTFGSGATYADPGPGIDDLTETLRNVGTLLIRHDPAPSPTPVGLHPQHILATLGIDNITAVLGAPLDNPIPEPIAKGTISIELETVASGLTAPVYLTHVGDGTDRLFVVDQPGKIWVIENGQLLNTPFLDATDRVHMPGFFG